MTERALVKRAVVALLNEIADEHSAGHQDEYAARYVLTTADASVLEILVEKGPKSPTNIWVLEKAGRRLRQQGVSFKLSPKSKLWSKQGTNGSTYGRHSGLLKLDQLRDEDLMCLAPENLEQLGTIVDHLLTVTAADLR